MKLSHWLFAIWILLSSIAFADDGVSTVGNIGATVIDPVSMTQVDSGVQITGDPPLYCTSDANGVICYY